MDSLEIEQEIIGGTFPEWLRKYRQQSPRTIPVFLKTRESISRGNAGLENLGKESYSRIDSLKGRDFMGERLRATPSSCPGHTLWLNLVVVVVVQLRRNFIFWLRRLFILWSNFVNKMFRVKT